MTNKYVHVEEHGKVLVLRLDDPLTRNAMGPEMNEELFAEIARFEKSTQLRCLVLTGTDPAFCSGANVQGQVKSVQQGGQKNPEENPPLPWGALDARYNHRATDADTSHGPAIVLTLARLQKPSIAAINGPAAGVGHVLALSCDIRIASDKASFLEIFARRGVASSDGSCWFLPRMIGLSNTYYMTYTGDAVDAQTALQWGLVTRVVPHEKLMEATLEVATKIAEGPVYALGMTKFLVQQSQSMTLEESLRLGAAAASITRTTEDFKEGMRSFLERRPPHFQGK